MLMACCGGTPQRRPSPVTKPAPIEVPEEMGVVDLRAQVDDLLGRGDIAQALAVSATWHEAHAGDAAGTIVYVDALVAAAQLDLAETASAELLAKAATSDALEAHGRVLVLRGDRSAGLADLRKAVELTPGDARYLASYGDGLERAGRADDAELVLRNAVKLDAKNARALRLLGIVRRDQYEPADAKTWLMAATEAAPDDADAWFHLALVQNELGDNTDAVASLRRATTLRPWNTSYQYAYGEVLRIDKKPEEAEVAYRKAIEGTPPHRKAAAKLALVMYEADRYPEAEAFLVAEIAKDAKNPYLRYTLGWVYEAEKKFAESKASFETYLELADRDDGDRGRAKAEIKSLARRLEREQARPKELERSVRKARRLKGAAAESAWWDVLELAPDHAEANYRLAVRMASVRRDENALDRLRAIRDGRADDAGVWLAKARHDAAFARLHDDPLYVQIVGAGN